MIEPVAWQRREATSNRHAPDMWTWSEWKPGRWIGGCVDRLYRRYEERPLYTAEALATARREALEEAANRKYRLGERVTKIKGSSWTGRIVGFYTTTLTPIGYAVESETESGSVQIYPESAIRSLPLDPIPDAGKLSTGGGDEG